jgi:hypothetical protein
MSVRFSSRMRKGFAAWCDRWRCGEGRISGVPKASRQRRQRLADLRRQQPPLGDHVPFPHDVNSRDWAIPWRSRTTSTAAIGRSRGVPARRQQPPLGDPVAFPRDVNSRHIPRDHISTTRANGGGANRRHPPRRLRGARGPMTTTAGRKRHPADRRSATLCRRCPSGSRRECARVSPDGCDRSADRRAPTRCRVFSGDSAMRGR